jgi:acetyltransferase-like isoleucine patch superfamily enzyme
VKESFKKIEAILRLIVDSTKQKVKSLVTNLEQIFNSNQDRANSPQLQAQIITYITKNSDVFNKIQGKVKVLDQYIQTLVKLDLSTFASEKEDQCISFMNFMMMMQSKADSINYNMIMPGFMQMPVSHPAHMNQYASP